jgi:predicted ester cyclase
VSEENKAVVRRLFEESDNRKGELPDGLFTPDYVFHFPGSPEPLDLQGHMRIARMLYAAFSDLRHRVEEQVTEGDKVASRFTMHGTHGGEFMGISPTGRWVAATGISIDRIAGGRIAEEWVNSDALGIMQQLGAIPSPGQREEPSAPVPSTLVPSAEQPASVVEDNKAVARRYFEEFLTGGNLDAGDVLLTPDVTIHLTPSPGAVQGIEEFKQAIRQLRITFPDMSFIVEDEIAEGDRVVSRFTFRATHRGEYQGIPPTGRQVEVQGINLFYLTGGRIEEIWVELDHLGMMHQLGVIPAQQHQAGASDLATLISAFDARWNRHDEEGVLGFFTEDAIVTTTPPPPGETGTYTGKNEIRGFVRNLLPGFHVDSRNHRVAGNEVRWESTLVADIFRRMGVDQAEVTTEAAFRGDKIESFRVAFSPQTVEKMRAAM